MLSDDEVERVLVVTAHPDDVDFGSAGTIAGFTAAGHEVTYCICTDGDAGGFDPDVPRSQIPGIRRSEQIAAAKVVGVTDVVFLGYPDGDVTLTKELRRDITRQIRRVRPQRLVTQSPVRNWVRIGISHPDHLTVGEATLRAVYPDARNPFAHPELAAEGLEAWKVAEVWLAGDPEANHWVDITDRLQDKFDAIKSHVSQLPMMDALEDTMKRFLAEGARRGGLPEGRYAESYRVLDTL